MAEYTSANTISITTPTSRPWARYTSEPDAPLIAIVSFAVEATNGRTIGSGAVYDTGIYPVYMAGSYSSSANQVNHSSGYGYTGVVTRMIWVPTGFSGTYTYKPVTNLRVVGTTVHYIYPSLPNFSDLSTNTYSDVLSSWFMPIPGYTSTSRTINYNTGQASAVLISAYSDGIANLADSSPRPTVTHTTNKLSTALGIVDKYETDGSLSVLFDDLYGSTSLTNAIVTDSTDWGANW